MKKKYIFPFFIFTLFSLSAVSQVNAYLLNNPVWQIKTTTYPSGSDPERYDDVFNYYTGGDTVIGSYTYKKIYKKGTNSHFASSGMPLGSYTYINNTPSFCLRSAAKEIFVCYPGNTSDILLYDFNLAPGDTLADTPVVNSQIITVTSIDSINTAFGSRKRFHLSSGAPGAPYLYEGAGSAGGLIEPVQGAFLSGTTELLCYSLNGTGYIPSTGPDCELALGIVSPENKSQSAVFPNPFSTTALFEFNEELKDASLDIFNISGQKLKTVVFSGNRFTLNRDGLAAGFYYYRVSTRDKNIAAGKLLITD